MENIYKQLEYLDRLKKHASDILECRIDAVLDDMGLTPLCDLPDEDAVTIEKFVNQTEVTCKEAAEALGRYSLC